MEESNGVRNWASSLDANALEQAERTARSPYVVGPVALMPDAHLGLGATVGSVIVTRGDTLLPAAVGVDIGCGMIAVETDFEAADIDADDRAALVQLFGRSVPSGVGQGHQAATPRAKKWIDDYPVPNHTVEDRAGYDSLVAKAANQLGSLGSGNHFLEVSEDERGVIWVVIHSGSRGTGNQLARFFIKWAQANAKAEGIELEDPDLAPLMASREGYNEYVDAMLWAQAYALQNREQMMDAALADLATCGDFSEERRIQCHHNFSERYVIDGEAVWITRKGAIRVHEGELGIIPGSMATATYLVEGLGNPLSYWSSAHGAGRRFSRGQARRTFSEESLIERMGDRGWNGGDGQSRHVKPLLDEHPDAYKDIEAVMADQVDLVRPIHTLTALVNYKGIR